MKLTCALVDLVDEEQHDRRITQLAGLLERAVVRGVLRVVAVLGAHRAQHVELGRLDRAPQVVDQRVALLAAGVARARAAEAIDLRHVVVHRAIDVDVVRGVRLAVAHPEQSAHHQHRLCLADAAGPREAARVDVLAQRAVVRRQVEVGRVHHHEQRSELAQRLVLEEDRLLHLGDDAARIQLAVRRAVVRRCDRRRRRPGRFGYACARASGRRCARASQIVLVVRVVRRAFVTLVAESQLRARHHRLWCCHSPRAVHFGSCVYLSQPPFFFLATPILLSQPPFCNPHFVVATPILHRCRRKIHKVEFFRTHRPLAICRSDRRSEADMARWTEGGRTTRTRTKNFRSVRVRARPEKFCPSARRPDGPRLGGHQLAERPMRTPKFRVRSARGPTDAARLELA